MFLFIIYYKHIIYYMFDYCYFTLLLKGRDMIYNTCVLRAHPKHK